MGNMIWINYFVWKLLCELLQLNIVRPSECDYLEMHVAWFELLWCCKTKWVWPLGNECCMIWIVMLLIMSCCALGLGLGVWALTNFIWMSCDELVERPWGTTPILSSTFGGSTARRNLPWHSPKTFGGSWSSSSSSSLSSSTLEKAWKVEAEDLKEKEVWNLRGKGRDRGVLILKELNVSLRSSSPEREKRD